MVVNRLLPSVLFAILLAVCPAILNAQDLLITEFVAQRTASIVDNFGDPADFIEIYNAGPTDVDLEGYFLSDGCTDLFKWSFPAGVTIESEAFLVVWATEKDVRDPNEPLHSNFRLDGAGGECVTLSDPFGDTIQAENFYPAQHQGYSYGIPMNSDVINVGIGTPCTVTVPSASNPIAGTGWQLSGYDDSAWVSGVTGVGYDDNPTYVGLFNLDLAVLEPMKDVNPSVYIRIPFQVDDPSVYSTFEFEMRYDDGYAAFIKRHACDESERAGVRFSEFGIVLGWLSGGR